LNDTQAGVVSVIFKYCDDNQMPLLDLKDIKKIILGGGQNLLSPERRFDAIIYNSPELFT
jgi:hypothetical protein